MKTQFFFVLVTICMLNMTNTFAQWSSTTALPGGAIANCVTADGSYLYAGTLAHGICRSSNNGADWVKINTNLTQMQVWAITITENGIFAGFANGSIMVSTNNGDTWTQANTGIPGTTIVKVIYKFGTRLYAGTSNAGVYMSTNNGAEWVKTNTGIPNQIANTFTAIDTSLYVGVGMSKGVYRSGLNSNWTAANTGLPNNSINALAYTKNSSLLFAGTYGGGVARSSNGGAAWQLVNTGLENNSVFSLASAGSSLYAGNELGVYKTTDNGDSWTGFNTGLTGASPVTGLFVQGNTLYAVYKGGIWKCNVPTATEPNKYAGTAEHPSFELKQNYPNPFNPSTTISYTLTEQGWVDLKVYDVLGREIRSLVSQSQKPGNYSVSFHADDLPSGVYISCLTCNGSRSLQKMNLLK